MKELKETFEVKVTKWVGSRASLIVHTLLFLGSFVSILFGAPADRVLLILTTVVSLEAIYLAIFIQMSVNKNTASLQEVEEDIEDIQEDVEEISKDVDEISKDVDEIQEDVEEIGEDVGEITEEIDSIHEDVSEISKDVDEIQEDLHEEFHANEGEERVRIEKHEITHNQLAELQKTLSALMKEIDDLKSRR